MFEAVGLLVDKLSRTQFGNLDVSGLRPGEYLAWTKKKKLAWLQSSSD